jgi:beta-lactamase class A
MRWASTIVAALGLLVAAGAHADGSPGTGEFSIPPDPRIAVVPRDAAPLWDWRDADLELQLQRSMKNLGLARALDRRTLSVALVDVSEPSRPRVAAIHGDHMFYAASLPKIAVMLAVFQKAHDGELSISGSVWEAMKAMIRRSSNRASTELMHLVGKSYIAEVLADPRYRLYDPIHNGGLWAGKDYASAGLWRRDPLHDKSHGATTMQVARFFYLLHTGRLVSPAASAQMKVLLADSEIDHKFVKGLKTTRPDAVVYRKAGTWQNWHADGALIERGDGTTYIAVALTSDSRGRWWLPRIIVAMDRLVSRRRPASASASPDAPAATAN